MLFYLRDRCPYRYQEWRSRELLLYRYGRYRELLKQYGGSSRESWDKQALTLDYHIVPDDIVQALLKVVR